MEALMLALALASLLKLSALETDSLALTEFEMLNFSAIEALVDCDS